MNVIGNNSELVVFAVSVVPALVLVFRFLLKLQVSGEDIYERRQSMQSATITEQQQIISDLKQLERDCKKRDELAQARIGELENEIVNLQRQVTELQAKS